MADLKRTHILRKADEHHRAGRYLKAQECLKQLLSRRRNDAEALGMLVIVTLELSQFEEAEALSRECTAMFPRSADFQILVGSSLVGQGRYDEALDHYEKASQLDPSNLRAIAGRADVYERRGDHHRSLKELRSIVDRGAEDPDIALQLIRTQTHVKEYEQAIEVATRNLTRRLTQQQRCMLLFGLGKALEKTGRADEAFRAYSEANDLHRVDRFDLDEKVRNEQMLIDALPAETMAGLPRATPPSTTLIFIVGMPRSGTTLTEFILDAHPLVRGVGERRDMTSLAQNLNLKIGSTLTYPDCVTDLEQSDVDELSREHIEHLRHSFPDDSEVGWFADKSMNTHRYLGLISLLFPNARLVWVRRDALDNCLGCFGEPLPPNNQPWGTDLFNIGVVYRMHERVMEHWREALDTPILEVHYEQLVQEPEAMTRRLVEFCGLPWDDACLRHHESGRVARTLSNEQVRQPIYTSSVSRAARFERHLGPLREALAAGERLHKE